MTTQKVMLLIAFVAALFAALPTTHGFLELGAAGWLAVWAVFFTLAALVG